MEIEPGKCNELNQGEATLGVGGRCAGPLRQEGLVSLWKRGNLDTEPCREGAVGRLESGCHKPRSPKDCLLTPGNWRRGNGKGEKSPAYKSSSDGITFYK